MIRKAINWPRVMSPESTKEAPTQSTSSWESFCSTWEVSVRAVPVIVFSKVREMYLP